MKCTVSLPAERALCPPRGGRRGPGRGCWGQTRTPAACVRVYLADLSILVRVYLADLSILVRVYLADLSMLVRVYLADLSILVRVPGWVSTAGTFR
eukprot:3576996-Pyramimonas_sp.AAC.1